MNVTTAGTVLAPGVLVYAGDLTGADCHVLRTRVIIRKTPVGSPEQPLPRNHDSHRTSGEVAKSVNMGPDWLCENRPIPARADLALFDSPRGEILAVCHA